MSEPVPDLPGARSGMHRDRRRYGRWLALAAALLVGVVIGGLIVAIFGNGDHITVKRAGPLTTSAPGPAPRGAVTIGLSTACLQAINDAQDVYAALGGIADAASHLDAAALDAIVRRVQQDQRQLSQDLPSCHALARLPNGSTSPVPLPTIATPSPTH